MDMDESTGGKEDIAHRKGKGDEEEEGFVGASVEEPSEEPITMRQDHGTSARFFL